MDFLQKDNSVNDDKDVIFSGGPLASDVYDFTVDSAFTIKSAGGAHGITFHLQTEAGSHRETIYVTNKKGEHIREHNGKKSYMMGFTLADHISLMTTGSPLADTFKATEKKIIKLWNKDANGEVDTEVDMIMGMVGKTFKAGVIQSIEDKKKKQGDSYVATGETRRVAAIKKIFHSKDGRTVNEIIAKEDKAVFIDQWLEKNRGIEVNNATGAAAAGTQGMPTAAAGAAAPEASLFS